MWAYFRFGYVTRVARRNYRQQKGLQLPHRVEWNENEWFSESSLSKKVVPWSHVLKWGESDKTFVLYASDVSYSILPKRAFPDDAFISDFRVLLERKNGPASAPKVPGRWVQTATGAFCVFMFVMNIVMLLFPA